MTNQDILRVSAASLAKIVLDEKYLVLLNRSLLEAKGITSYGPIGGAIEYHSSSREVLEELGVQEFLILDEASARDLRFLIESKNYAPFKEWFNLRERRERDIYRELHEELVLEESIFPTLTPQMYSSTYEGVITLPLAVSQAYPNAQTQRIVELYKVQFDQEREEKLQETLLIENSPLRLVDKEEILAGKFADGSELAKTCQCFLYSNNSF